jgi:hypothetical protein
MHEKKQKSVQRLASHRWNTTSIQDSHMKSGVATVLTTGILRSLKRMRSKMRLDFNTTALSTHGWSINHVVLLTTEDCALLMCVRAMTSMLLLSRSV